MHSLSSRDRTPVKSPSKSTIVLRSSPRKRLMLGGDNEMTTPEKKTNFVDGQKSNDINGTNQKQFAGNLVNGLRGLSQEQLVKVIMDLVSMQEDGMLSHDDKLRDLIIKKMPIADIQPLRERLSVLRQNVYASLVSSNIDDNAYSRAYVHLDAFEVRADTLSGAGQHFERPIFRNVEISNIKITKEIFLFSNFLFFYFYVQIIRTLKYIYIYIYIYIIIYHQIRNFWNFDSFTSCQILKICEFSKFNNFRNLIIL